MRGQEETTTGTNSTDLMLMNNLLINGRILITKIQAIDDEIIVWVEFGFIFFEIYEHGILLGVAMETDMFFIREEFHHFSLWRLLLFTDDALSDGLTFLCQHLLLLGFHYDNIVIYENRWWFLASTLLK